MASSLKVGAAWWQQDRNGNHYLSIAINSPAAILVQPDQRLHLYANPSKQEGDRLPDYELVILPIAEWVPSGHSSAYGRDGLPRQERETAPAPPPPLRPAAPTQSGRNGGNHARPAPAPEPESDLGDGLEDPFGDDAPPARSQGRQPVGRR